MVFEKLGVGLPHDFLLQVEGVLAIVPAPLRHQEKEQIPIDVVPVLRVWVRCLLLLLAMGLVGVFMLAAMVNPYEADGQPRRMGTHLQLGLPPCTFQFVTGVPCPSCGMTTSFSLLMHADVPNSVRANAVGTMLAAFCLLLIPWCVLCAGSRRLWIFVEWEKALIVIVLAFMVLLLLRWGIVLTMRWLIPSGAW